MVQIWACLLGHLGAWRQDPESAKLPTFTPRPPAHRLSNAVFTPTQERLLSKRDACTNAFGAGWIGSTCTPGSTYCCVNPSQAVPLCEQYLGIGWCCTQDGGCYADLQPACGQPGAVSCTELAAGVDEACCPQHTTCAPGYNATSNFVRCNIKHTSLESIASSSSTISGALTATSTASPDVVAAELTSTSSVSATSSSYTASSLELSTSAASPIFSHLGLPSGYPSISIPAASPTSQTKQGDLAGLSPGTTAGVAIGAAAGALLLAALSWLVWQKRTRERASILDNQYPVHPQHGPSMNLVSYDKPCDNDDVYSSSSRRSISASTSKHELPTYEWRSPAELATERF